MKRSRELLPRPFVLLSTLSLGLLCVVLAGGAHPGAVSSPPVPEGAPASSHSGPGGAPVSDGKPAGKNPAAPEREPDLPDPRDAALPPALCQTSAGGLFPLSPCRRAGPAPGHPGKPFPGGGPVPPDLWSASWPHPALAPDPFPDPSGEALPAPRKKPAQKPHPARAPPGRV